VTLINAFVVRPFTEDLRKPRANSCKWAFWSWPCFVSLA